MVYAKSYVVHTFKRVKCVSTHIYNLTIARIDGFLVSICSAMPFSYNLGAIPLVYNSNTGSYIASVSCSNVTENVNHIQISSS